ncbi:MAG: hypothetical protein C0184_00555, partial [Chloroflexus aggregans]
MVIEDGGRLAKRKQDPLSRNVEVGRGLSNGAKWCSFTQPELSATWERGGGEGYRNTKTNTQGC